MAVPASPVRQPLSAGGLVLSPTVWTSTWTDAALAHAAGFGRAASLMATGCGASTVTAALGWTAGGTVSVYGVSTWDGSGAALSATFSVGAIQYGPLALGQSVSVPDGPLALSLALTSSCGASSWSRVIVTDVDIGIEPAAAPASFVIRRGLGMCLRALLPIADIIASV